MAVAEQKACDPTDLPPLQAVIDADALDALLAPRGNGHGPDDSDFEISFAYADTVVRLSRDGGLSVEPVAVNG